MDNLLWKIIISLRKVLGSQFTDRLIDSFIGRAYNNFMYFLDMLHPSEEMLAARTFFFNNSNRVNRMILKLGDEKSKIVLRKVIKYRQSHDRKDRPDYSREDQYFPKDIIKLNENEVFVDCGAYDGDTIKAFLDFSNGKCKKIIAFEPDPDNYNKIMSNYDKVKIVKAAVWNENTFLSFNNGDASGSRVDNDGKDKVKAVKLDDVTECDDATFIKMDIEGAEYNALLGAENTIKNNRPILAICIYHSDEDILRLFELIDNWDLGYKFFVRHHAQKIAETVLYAVV